jgi:hypothetical protein
VTLLCTAFVIVITHTHSNITHIITSSLRATLGYNNGPL